MSIKTRLDLLERKYKGVIKNPFADMTDEELKALAHQEPSLAELKNVPKNFWCIYNAEFGEGYVERRLKGVVC